VNVDDGEDLDSKPSCGGRQSLLSSSGHFTRKMVLSVKLRVVRADHPTKTAPTKS